MKDARWQHKHTRANINLKPNMKHETQNEHFPLQNYCYCKTAGHTEKFLQALRQISAQQDRIKTNNQQNIS